MKYMIVIKATNTIPNIPYFFVCRLSFRELISLITCMAHRKLCKHVPIGTFVGSLGMANKQGGLCVYTRVSPVRPSS